MTKCTIYEKFLLPEQPFQVYLVISFHLNCSKVDKTFHHSAFIIFTIILLVTIYFFTVKLKLFLFSCR